MFSIVVLAQVCTALATFSASGILLPLRTVTKYIEVPHVTDPLLWHHAQVFRGTRTNAV